MTTVVSVKTAKMSKSTVVERTYDYYKECAMTAVVSNQLICLLLSHFLQITV